MSPLRKLLLLLALCALLAVVWWVPPDARATQQVDAGLKRALTSFAAARALDAVISVAQGTQIALEPGGVGVVLAPGQALDPINDLVEQFSTLMLLASVSFGVQRALIAIGSHVAVSVLVTAAALGWAALRWRGRPPLGLTRLLLVLLLARFAVPLVVLGSDLAFQTFLYSDYAAAQRAIDGSARQIDQAGSPAPAARVPADEGHVERLKRWWATAVDKPDVGKRLEELRQIASGAADHIVRLIVVFLLQTLVLPLLLLWSLLGLGRGLYAVVRRAH